MSSGALRHGPFKSNAAAAIPLARNGLNSRIPSRNPERPRPDPRGVCIDVQRTKAIVIADDGNGAILAGRVTRRSGPRKGAADGIR